MIVLPIIILVNARVESKRFWFGMRAICYLRMCLICHGFHMMAIFPGNEFQQIIVPKRVRTCNTYCFCYSVAGY